MMRLLILSKRTTAHGFGGMETHVEATARAAAELGHEVVVLTTAHPQGLMDELRDGVTVKYLAGTAPGLDSRIWWRKSTDAVRCLLGKGFGDLILSVSLAGYGVAASKVGVPHYAFSFGNTLAHLSSEWHNTSGLMSLAAYPKHALTLFYYAGLERRLWGRLDGIIATYDALYEDLLRQRRRAVLCYNGTDPRLFRPDPVLRDVTRQALGIPDEALVLLMVATVNRQKGIWLGVEAFGQLAPICPAVHLVIVGDGPDRLRLEHGLRGSSFRSQVHFVGAVPFQTTAAYFATADLFLYPTLRAEGLPNAIVQAMAAGLPVVAVDRGGICSAVSHTETGLLLPTPAVGPLVEALAGLLADPHRLTSMGRRARERALACFDIQILVAELLQALGGLAGK